MERGRSARLFLKELGDLAGTWSAKGRNELRLLFGLQDPAGSLKEGTLNPEP